MSPGSRKSSTDTAGCRAGQHQFCQPRRNCYRRSNQHQTFIVIFRSWAVDVWAPLCTCLLMWRYVCCSFDLPIRFGPRKSAVFQGLVENTNLSVDTISADYNHWWYKHTSWPPRGFFLQAVQWPNRLIWSSNMSLSQLMTLAELSTLS